ncbi:protein O-linked-mannose beta-1,2-N-acetylglucosaminyltransferase 1-like [Mercenaria mercenaria]|uniref:protein O-linked-mannose beta-1,2-N-acetylglucosaminyltransferase 1-like n=1 Tax=Mercenaria mercenaria TaxID=6596 RepID=UPI00234F7F0A|nr:protein O-linked-mannose beta-1,2-N-acetylglucosaminyltransferase 1-like [Mercenaria mercenaria]
MTIGRKCKRKFGVKKLFVLTILCCLALYIGSVVHRARGFREVWTPTGFVNVTDGHCGVKCGHGQIGFYVKTGVEIKEGPVICYQNQIVVSDKLKNFDRGMNIVIINDKTLVVEYVKTYDTYVDDYEFHKDMKTLVKEGHIIILASYDEISENLSEEGHRWVKIFGSELIDQVNFRDSFMLIGQKGLKQGYAIEFAQNKGEKLYSDGIEKQGCFTLPLGPVLPVEEVMYQLVSSKIVNVGKPMEYCGLKTDCSDREFSVMVSTGSDSTKLPEICVSGYMIMDSEVNNAGRGMNVVVVDHHTGKAKSVTRFDTYEKDSLNLELHLESMMAGDIVIAVAFDDASRKLNFHTREILNELGSSMAQNIKFRDVWYFVGQKGIKGFTNMEKISYAGMDAEWPTPILDAFCVPSKIEGSDMIPDPPANRNDVRREFCKKYDGYGEFCHPEHVDNPFLQPAELTDEHLKENLVYSSPIVIIPGLNHNALVRTMETTVMQQGVKLENILVAWDEKFPELAELANMFGFRNVSLDSSVVYTDQMIKALEKAASIFPTAKYMIVIEEELVLSPDFLYFLAKCTSALEKDHSLLGVSAFNFNGFVETSSNKSLVYRVEDFPGLAFMIKMTAYTERMKGGLKSCCNERAWYGWSLPMYNQSHAGYMLVPDVSRVYRYPYQGFNSDEDYLVSLFNKPRETNLDKDPTLHGVEELTGSKYDSVIKKFISTASHLNHRDVKNCSSNNTPIKLPESRRNFQLFYNQTKPTDYSVLLKLRSCFHLLVTVNHAPKHLYKGVLRFTYTGNNIMLIGSSSDFAALKPTEIQYYNFR